MKIILLGAGQVGGTLAEHLASEDNDITIVDTDQNRLHELNDRLDIRTVLGHGSFPDVLEKAGAADADMLVAVTSRDEVNMVACKTAHALFKIDIKICRIRSSAYLEEKRLFPPREEDKERLGVTEWTKRRDKRKYFPIDVLISPEKIVTTHIQRLLEYPGTLQVLDFSAGLVQLVAIQASWGGPLVGHELSDLRVLMPNIDTRVAAIFRRGRPIIPEGKTVIEDGDEVFFISASKHIRSVMSKLKPLEKPYKRIMIAGGGNIGYRLASTMEKRTQVKLIEKYYQRCMSLSETLAHTTVLQGDATSRELLYDENIDKTDVFCAVTNDDEVNIISALLAKKLGVRKVMALINKPAYVDLIQGKDIDIAISPQQVTIGSLLTHIRRGHVEKVHSLRRGAAEAIEAIAHGDRYSSRVVGRRIEEIPLPEGCTIGAIVRDEKTVIIGHGNTVIHQNDHVILFLVDKNRIREVEKLFSVEATFF